MTGVYDKTTQTLNPASLNSTSAQGLQMPESRIAETPTTLYPPKGLVAKTGSCTCNTQANSFLRLIYKPEYIPILFLRAPYYNYIVICPKTSFSLLRGL